MNHNLETVKLKLRAYNTYRGKLGDVFKELESLEKELREIIEDYENHGELRYSTIETIKQILGKKELIRKHEGKN